MILTVTNLYYFASAHNLAGAAVKQCLYTVLPPRSLVNSHRSGGSIPTQGAIWNRSLSWIFCSVPQKIFHSLDPHARRPRGAPPLRFDSPRFAQQQTTTKQMLSGRLLWTLGESNPLPLPCHGSALPNELRAREFDYYTDGIKNEKGIKKQPVFGAACCTLSVSCLGLGCVGSVEINLQRSQ